MFSYEYHKEVAYVIWGYDTQAGILMFEETVHVNLTGY